MLVALPALLFALATSAAAVDLQKRTHILDFSIKRPHVFTGSLEDFASKIEWLHQDTIRAGLKHLDLESEEGKAKLEAGLAALQKRAGDTNTLKNWASSYSVSIDIGTPPQKFDSLVDTGSGDLWVIEKCNDQKECGLSKPFVPAKSSTFQASNVPYYIGYLSGATSGYWAQDVVRIGKSVNTTKFGAASQVSKWQTAASSLIGFSYAGTKEEYKPWWLNVINTWEQPLFSLYLGRVADRPAANESPDPNGGHLLLGGTDSSKYKGSINYSPLRSAQRTSAGGPVDWEIALDGIKVSGKSVKLPPAVTSRGQRKTRSAYIDSGTTAIYGPAADVTALYGQIPGAYKEQGTWFIPPPASGSYNIAFTFNGVDYKIDDGDAIWVCGSPRQLGISSKLPYLCEGIIQVAELDTWLVGDAFLKNVYAVFRKDPAAIGFAPLQDSANIVYEHPWAQRLHQRADDKA